jgi:hypothetical protein
MSIGNGPDWRDDKLGKEKGKAQAHCDDDEVMTEYNRQHEAERPEKAVTGALPTRLVFFKMRALKRPPTGDVPEDRRVRLRPLPPEAACPHAEFPQR